jgi:hypothetical protein
VTEGAKASAALCWENRSPEERQRVTDAATAGRQRAARANRLAKHVDEVLAQAGELTPGQIAALRALLPTPADNSGPAGDR